MGKTKSRFSLGEAVTKVGRMPYDIVKAVLSSHGVEIWMDQPPVLRRLLAEKIADGTICDPTDDSDVVVNKP